MPHVPRFAPILQPPNEKRETDNQPVENASHSNASTTFGLIREGSLQNNSFRRVMAPLFPPIHPTGQPVHADRKCKHQ